MKKKTYMIVATANLAYYEVYIKMDNQRCGEFVCKCTLFVYAKKICDALEKQDAE